MIDDEMRVFARRERLARRLVRACIALLVVAVIQIIYLHGGAIY